MTFKWSEVSGYGSSYDVLGYLLRLTSSIWRRQLNAELGKIGLTEMQFVLLAGLGGVTELRGEGVSQRELAEACGCSTALASQVLQKLVAKQLIIIENDRRDSRARMVRLSRAGEDVLTQAVKILERADIAFRSDDPSLFQDLYDVLRRVIAVKIGDTTEPGHDFGATPTAPLGLPRK